MESTGREAEPHAKGIFAVAKQSFRDLFRWEQRVEIFVGSSSTCCMVSRHMRC